VECPIRDGAAGPLTRVRLVVPRLADHGERDGLWEFCRDYWREQLPEFELVEGHHEGDRPFNRSASINQAAKGHWDVAVILDSDTIVDADEVRAAVALAAESGELVLPFHLRNMLSAEGTKEILGDYVGSWNRWVKLRERDRVSCCVVVPRGLWDEVGGFDERFEGWGGEDEAFHAACTLLKGCRRTKGEVWHLHHAASPHHDHSTPLYREALQLRHRYMRITEPDAMRRFLTESREPNQIVLVALTTGKRETLEATIASAEESLQGPIGRRLMCVDGPPEIAREAAERYPRWDIEQIRGGGYPKAVASALDRAIGSGQPWVFWLEDDFTFNERVDLVEMQELVNRHDLAQLSLMRQPWYEPEVEAGGVIAANPSAFTQRDGYVEHSAYWTMNPMLTRRSTLAAHQWPQGRRSELRFGHSVFEDPRVRAGILGEIDDPPRVEHIGAVQAGKGY
jgi:glycosyl transferase family 7 (putative galactosyltransferase)